MTRPRSSTCLARSESGLGAGKILVDTTTGDPQRTHDLAVWLAAGVEYLEAPISGSSEQTAPAYVDGIGRRPPQAFEACRDLLDSLAAKTYYVGRWGNAVRMKLVTNLVLGLNRAVLAEGWHSPGPLGYDGQCAGGVAEQPCLLAHHGRQGSQDGRRRFRAASQALAAPQGRAVDPRRGGPAPGSGCRYRSCIGICLDEAEAIGLGELDNSVIIQAIERPPLRHH